MENYFEAKKKIGGNFFKCIVIYILYKYKQIEMDLPVHSTGINEIGETIEFDRVAFRGWSKYLSRRQMELMPTATKIIQNELSSCIIPFHLGFIS